MQYLRHEHLQVRASVSFKMMQCCDCCCLRWQVPNANDFDSAVPLRVRPEAHNSLNNRFKPDARCSRKHPGLRGVCPHTLHHASSGTADIASARCSSSFS